MEESSRINNSPTQQDIDLAYVIKDKYFEPLHVRKTANAWWKDRTKVEEFIKSLKNGHSIEVSCIYVGISNMQYRYFNKIHPEFREVKIACRAINFLRAQETVTADMDNIETAKWFLSKRDKRYRTGEGEDEDDYSVLQPQTQFNINQGVVVNQQENINPEELKKIGKEIFMEVFGKWHEERAKR